MTVEILRRNGEFHDVAGAVLVPGLVCHCSINARSKITITHEASGLAILHRLPKGYRDLAYRVLSRHRWDVPAEEIFGSVKHRKAVELLMSEYMERSQAQEKRIAEDTGGKVQAGSGGTWGYSGDVASPVFLMEAKSPPKGWYALQFKELAHLTKKAYQMGRLPAFIIELPGKEEVVFLKYSDLDPEWAHPIEKEILFKKGQKGFRVSSAMVTKVRDGKGILVVGPETYLALGYNAFLVLAKPDVT